MGKSLDEIAEDVLFELKNSLVKPGESEFDSTDYRIAMLSTITIKRFLEIYEEENKK